MILFVSERENMNKIGIVKEIDKLGRVLIPKELRERYGLNSSIEMVVTEEGILIKNQEYYLMKKEI